MTLRESIEWLVSKLGEASTRNLATCLDEMALHHGESERFLSMDRCEQFYRGIQHDAKCAGWDGRMVARSHSDRSNAHAHGMSEDPVYLKTPWYNRRPYVRKQLCPSVVHRFTSLLFGETRIPRIESLDDSGKADGQDWISHAIDACEWWSRWSEARDLGGAVGSVVAVLQILDGEPLVEVVNAKLCTPQWKGDKSRRELAAIDIRYKHNVTKVVSVTQRDGSRREVLKDVVEWFWRVIDDQVDVVLSAPVETKGALDWTVERWAAHGLGFCPAVWVQNTECTSDDDGLPDCDQQWDNFDALDALMSDAFKGTHYNADPTVVMKSDQDVSQIKTGSDGAILLEKGGDVSLLELQGTGGKAAQEQAAVVKDSILEDVRCVLDEGEASGRSATELVKRTESMYERADDLRRQYGDAMRRAFMMLLRICRKLGFARLPSLKKYTPPKTDEVVIVWPPYVQMTPADKEIVIRQFSMARTSGLVSRKTAVKALASLLGIEDVDEELALLAAEEAEKSARYEAILGGDPAEGGQPGQKPGQFPSKKDDDDEDEDEPEDDGSKSKGKKGGEGTDE